MYKVFASLCYVTLTICVPINTDFGSLSDFSIRLMENIAVNKEGNFAFSPLSVWNIYSLLAEGASGRTFEELMLQLNLPKDIKATQALRAAVENIFEPKSDVTLMRKAALFADCSTVLHKEFCESAKFHNTDVYAVDAKNTTKLALDINYFVCVATEGYIKDLVRPDMLDDLNLLMIDAVYFKANWTHPFDPAETKIEAFYDQHGRNIGKVNMMYQKAPNNVAFVEKLDAEILEMPYGKDERFSMLIILPLQGSSLKRLLKNLSLHPFEELARELQNAENLPAIECYVPKFKITARIDLVQPLKYMGLYNIFDQTKSELPGISDTQLFVSESFQKVVLDVSEEGTKVAAATVVQLEDRLLGQRFEVNRPFIYFIIERKSNVILFAGVYTEPSVV